MTVPEELSILDLLKEQLPGRVGCLCQTAPTKSASCDPVINEILTFVRTVVPCQGEHEVPSHPNTKDTSQMFFGISQGKEADSGLEQLTDFIQSQIDLQPPSLGLHKSPTSQLHTNLTGVTAHCHNLSSGIQHPTEDPEEGTTSDLKCPENQGIPSNSGCKISQEAKPEISQEYHPVKDTKENSECEVETNVVFRKQQTKADPNTRRETENGHAGPSKSTDVKSGQASSKDHVRAKKDSTKDPVKNTSKGQDIKSYKLPFISTDELENQDNEDPRWQEQAKLSTNEERYVLARKLWKNPCVPDPNRNLTVFGSALQTFHSDDSSARRKRRREQCLDGEDLQPSRKRQRRFENVAWSTNHIARSKRVVMNEFLENIHLPNLTRDAARKLESTHEEKQYMLDLALEEVKAIHQFYDGLPNQDLIMTREDVAGGFEAMEHVYQVFGRVYGYKGQEFFP